MDFSNGAPSSVLNNLSRLQVCYPLKESFPMNVLFSSMEYDFHTLIKVAEIAGLAGVVSFHQAGDDYLVTFPDVEKTEEIVKNYRTRLRDLENNIWSH